MGSSQGLDIGRCVTLHVPAFAAALPVLSSGFSPLAAAISARKVTWWRLDLPLVVVARSLRDPSAPVGDPKIPQIES